ncbi:hypothetical protein BT63DRAFT_460621 [Microthyrium microscopicum]|uniref:N-acetyltransferase domain-containing protein n=1 Tax=Microthyrium microscopicum TaxID=703497 RepID=A0A6A6TW84_9PEZI|nr:hypothetical protein BT63DRAFT_460621 [Microthyrium microscopicum]
MQLKLSEATADDAARIAEIHMTAFGSNIDIEDPKITVLVVRAITSKNDNTGHSEVIGFAKLVSPVLPEEEYSEPE